MPRGDRTGPWGQGSRTGRGLGYCGGYPSPGFTRYAGMGWGRGYGGGRGWGRGGWPISRRFYPVTDYPVGDIPWRPMSSVSPLVSAEEEEKYLEETLSSFKKEMRPKTSNEK